jgi:trehalose 6-phosphate synthase
VLSQYLHGERVVIVAYREPSSTKGSSGIKIVHPASGLVSALEPVMRACSVCGLRMGLGVRSGCSDARGT